MNYFLHDPKDDVGIEVLNNKADLLGHKKKFVVTKLLQRAEGELSVISCHLLSLQHSTKIAPDWPLV